MGEERPGGGPEARAGTDAGRPGRVPPPAVPPDGPPAGAAGRVGEARDQRRRLSLFQLLGLAAGGAVGSGWLLSATTAYRAAGAESYLTWLFGGLLMLVIGGVMVELGTAAPKTGGLIFLPLLSSGPLMATVVAAGVWVLYAINSASEAVAMSRGIVPPDGDHLTAKGWLLTAVFMVVVFTVNLIAPRLFLQLNAWLTVLKVAVPVTAVALFLASGFDHRGGNAARLPEHGTAGILQAVVSSGVVFAYVGFQGPLDLAGNIKGSRKSEKTRLRVAVYGTILATTVLYTLLQLSFNHYCHAGPGPGPHLCDLKGPNVDSPYAKMAEALSATWLLWLLRIDAVISPMGAGMVFGHALTREAAALSRAHLTHRGLQAARHAALRIRGRSHDVYWLLLLVDLGIGAAALVVVGGDWQSLVTVSGDLALVVYAVPAVVLVALADRLHGTVHDAGRGGRRTVHAVLARLSFVLAGLVLFTAGWSTLWVGLAALGIGCVLLFALPVAAGAVPGMQRFYDAEAHLRGLARWREPAVWLLAYLAALALLTPLGNHATTDRFDNTVQHPTVWGAVTAAVLALAAFEVLVRLSRAYLRDRPRPPVLPGARR